MVKFLVWIEDSPLRLAPYITTAILVADWPELNV